MMRITDTSYNFTGLKPDTSYTVTVAGRSDAGVGEFISMVTTTAGKNQLFDVCAYMGINE